MIKHWIVCGLILVVMAAGCTSGPGTIVETTGTASLEASAATGTQAIVTESPAQQSTSITATATTLPAAGEKQVILAHTEKMILRSSDGGQIWQEVTPSGLLGALAASGETFGSTLKVDFSGEFGLAGISQTNRVLVYRTKDGGLTWTESVVELEEEAQSVVSVDVLGEQSGWLLVSRGVGAGNEWVDLYATQDGGASWSYLSWSSTEADPFGRIPSGGLKSGVRFNDQQTGWISGSAPIEYVYLFRSLDGGQTWAEYPLPLPDEVAMPGTSSPPEFFTDDLGVIGVTVYTHTDAPGVLFFWTKDGGETWQSSAVLEGNFSTWDWLDEEHGFVAGTDDDGQTRLHVTRDGGLSWEVYPVELAYISQVEFVSEQTGWAICGWREAPWPGCTGELYRSLDGGRSWEIAYP